MDIFVKRVTLPQEESLAGPSGGIQEEGLVIIGDDSFMCVIGPKSRKWDKIWR